MSACTDPTLPRLPSPASANSPATGPTSRSLLAITAQIDQCPLKALLAVRAMAGAGRNRRLGVTAVGFGSSCRADGRALAGRCFSASWAEATSQVNAPVILLHGPDDPRPQPPGRASARRLGLQPVL